MRNEDEIVAWMLAIAMTGAFVILYLIPSFLG